MKPVGTTWWPEKPLSIPPKGGIRLCLKVKFSSILVGWPIFKSKYQCRLFKINESTARLTNFFSVESSQAKGNACQLKPKTTWILHYITTKFILDSKKMMGNLAEERERAHSLMELKYNLPKLVRSSFNWSRWKIRSLMALKTWST